MALFIGFDFCGGNLLLLVTSIEETGGEPLQYSLIISVSQGYENHDRHSGDI